MKPEKKKVKQEKRIKAANAENDANETKLHKDREKKEKKASRCTKRIIKGNENEDDPNKDDHQIITSYKMGTPDPATNRARRGKKEKGTPRRQKALHLTEYPRTIPSTMCVCVCFQSWFLFLREPFPELRFLCVFARGSFIRKPR